MGAESEGEALDLLVDFCSYPRWVVIERTRSRVQAAEMSFLHMGGWALP